MNEQIQTIDTINDEQIAQWKSKYGKVFKIEVEDKSCYLKEVDRKTLSFATQAGSNDPLKFNEAILKNCWLGGDLEIQTETSYFLGAGQALAEMLEVKKGKLVKL